MLLLNCSVIILAQITANPFPSTHPSHPLGNPCHLQHNIMIMLLFFWWSDKRALVVSYNITYRASSLMCRTFFMVTWWKIFLLVSLIYLPLSGVWRQTRSYRPAFREMLSRGRRRRTADPVSYYWTTKEASGWFYQVLLYDSVRGWQSIVLKRITGERFLRTNYFLITHHARHARVRSPCFGLLTFKRERRLSCLSCQRESS